MRYSKSNLTRIETILKKEGYSIRYERGNFQSGFCILKEKKVIVINKFLEVKQKIDHFSLILNQIDPINPELQDDKDLEFLKSIANQQIDLKLVA
jgi:hypothetical protein